MEAPGTGTPRAPSAAVALAPSQCSALAHRPARRSTPSAGRPATVTFARCPPCPRSSSEATERFVLECSKTALPDGVPRLGHQTPVEPEVVNTEQPVSQNFARHVKVAQVRAAV